MRLKADRIYKESVVIEPSDGPRWHNNGKFFPVWTPNVSGKLLLGEFVCRFESKAFREVMPRSIPVSKFGFDASEMVFGACPVLAFIAIQDQMEHSPCFVEIVHILEMQCLIKDGQRINTFLSG